jgi:hypothetical protein
VVQYIACRRIERGEHGITARDVVVKRRRNEKEVSVCHRRRTLQDLPDAEVTDSERMLSIHIAAPGGPETGRPQTTCRFHPK